MYHGVSLPTCVLGLCTEPKRATTGQRWKLTQIAQSHCLHLGHRMASLPDPPEFKAMMSTLMDFAQQGVVPQSQLPPRLDRRCTLALNELQQANQYESMGATFSRETFVHLHRFLR